MSGSIRDAMKAYSPKWLQGTVGEKFIYTIGLACDALAEKANEAMRLHIPTYGDYSALATIGNDRLIPQGPNEGPANYALRLRAAYDDWARAGSSRSVLRQILGFLSPSAPFVRVVGNGTATGTPWDTYLAAADTTKPPAHYRAVPANWNWDGGPWYRVWIIIDCSTGSPWTNEGTWGDGKTWGDGGTWGSTATLSNVQTMQGIVALWKAANVAVVNIILSFDATLFDPAQPAGSVKLPDGNFGLWEKVNASGSVPSRFSSAAYWDGVP